MPHNFSRHRDWDGEQEGDFRDDLPNLMDSFETLKEFIFEKKHGYLTEKPIAQETNTAEKILSINKN